MMIDCDLLLCWGAIHKKIEKGFAIFSEGEEAHFYYQVLAGKVKMANGNDNGKEFIQGLFSVGETFGELPLFDNKPYPASAIAEEDTVLLRLRKESFLQLLKDNADIHFSFTRLLANRLRNKSITSNELSCYGAEHRIVTLIKQLKSTGKVIGDAKYSIDLTRQQIANMTGLRVETVIRIIRGLYGKGELLLKKGKIYI